MTIYSLACAGGLFLEDALIGIFIGLTFGFLLIGFDILFRRFNLRSFNITIIGLFIGYLMGQALVLIFDAILNVSSIPRLVSSQTLELLKIALFLFSTYLGAIMTLRAADKIYITIPFVKFAPTAHKKRDLLIDMSVLLDARIIDLCSTGILDQHLVIPRFVMKELHAQIEMGDESSKKAAKRCVETVKKMGDINHLSLRFNETDFPEIKDTTSKLIRLAHLVDANILTADMSPVQIASFEDIQIINLHALSNALKPLMETGELIRLKVQRYGKEPRQGVGYLDDGTMVVVNEGGDFIGETIEAQVLSVKHTSSGRMVFCNVCKREMVKHSDWEDGRR